MKFSSMSAILAFGLISHANATCYTSGAEGGQAQANAKVGRMCDFLSGPYAPGQEKHHCFDWAPQSSSGPIYRWDFVINNRQSINGFVSHDSCVTLLKREIGCPKGGESIVGGVWRFVADRNDGNCRSNFEA